jgi:hypothetical protein
MNLTAFDRVSSDWFSIARKKAFTGWSSTFNVRRSTFGVWRLAFGGRNAAGEDRLGLHGEH